MREKIYLFIEPSDNKSIYDYCMIVVIAVSLLPLCFKQDTQILSAIDYATAFIFIIDYALRLITADYKLNKGAASFFVYPFTFLAIIDAVSIFPTFLPLSAGFKTLKVIRLLRSFRAFKALKIFRYSKNFDIIITVIKKQSAALLAVCTLAAGYVFISALIVFNIEPDTFNSFFDAIYWATVSLTTVGYGDIYPLTSTGKVLAMVSSFIGIAIVALPAGIITAGYMDEVSIRNKG